MRKMFTLFSFAILFFVKGWGQAPVNDICSGAIALTCGSSYSGTNENATTDMFLPDCGELIGAFGKGVWFKYTAAANGKATFSTVGGAT